jgi:hypothetical protein
MRRGIRGIWSDLVRKGPRENGPWAELGEDTAELGGFYLGNPHHLVHRHVETVELNADDSCNWSLKVDFELPTDPRASRPLSGEEAQFLFPLIFLRKAEGHIGFYVRDETGMRVLPPTRAKSDEISALAASQAAERLLIGTGKTLRRGDLKGLLTRVAASKPYDSSVILNEVLHGLDPEIVSIWEEGELIDDLHGLMEHSIVWLPIRGRPGERREIEVGQALEHSHRAILRWSFGKLKPRKTPRLLRSAPRFSGRLLRDRRPYLETGKARYGRRAFRISFPALGERMVRPFGWVPIQWEFPTIYTRRCDSYHFEVTCPTGLSPIDLRVVTGKGDEKPIVGRRTLRAGSAHLYLPGSRTVGDMTIRVFVGVGAGAFPVLWFLAGALTSIVLWAFAASDPAFLDPGTSSAGKNEIAAGILLTVPAVLAALVVTEEGDVTRMIWGARLLLFIPALCSVGATAVLIGAEPFNMGPRSVWTVCAAVSTAATVPLAISWSISSPLMRRQLKKLDTPSKQYIGLGVLLVIAAALLGGIVLAGEEWPWRRAVAAVGLALMAVPMLLIGTNRAAVPFSVSRRYVSISGAFAAAVCLVLGCIELRAAFDDEAKFHEEVELWGLVLFPTALLIGPLLAKVTGVFRMQPGEIHISPEDGRRILARESIAELRYLREQGQLRSDSAVAEDGAIVAAHG